MYVFEWAHLDYDDYPIGMAFDPVGPFDSHEDAVEWVKATFNVEHYWYARHPTDPRAKPEINQLRYNMVSPEEYVRRRA